MQEQIIIGITRLIKDLGLAGRVRAEIVDNIMFESN